MDLQAQRLRVGLPYFVDYDLEQTLDQVNKTPAKFRNDTTIRIYEAKALAGLLRHEEAEAVALSLNDPSERATLLYDLRRSWGDESGAIAAWNNRSEPGMANARVMVKSGFEFHSLEQDQAEDEATQKRSTGQCHHDGAPLERCVSSCRQIGSEPNPCQLGTDRGGRSFSRGRSGVVRRSPNGPSYRPHQDARERGHLCLQERGLEADEGRLRDFRGQRRLEPSNAHRAGH